MEKTDTVVIGDYYVDTGFLRMVYDEVKEDVLRANRIEARKIQHERNVRRMEQAAERRYFANQRFFGVLWCVFVLIAAAIISEVSVLALLIPGIILITTKKMVVVNNYWYEHGRSDQWTN